MSIWKPHKSDQELTTHSEDRCMGDFCPVHNPSDHHMADWPQHYRGDLGITERICPHGIGHPDPDDIYGCDHPHGCDGCCIPPEEDEEQVPMIRRFTRWIRRVLADQSHHDNSEMFEESLCMNLTQEEEIERLNKMVTLYSEALDIMKAYEEEQKKQINLLNVASGMTKKRGRPRKN